MEETAELKEKNTSKNIAFIRCSPPKMPESSISFKIALSALFADFAHSWQVLNGRHETFILRFAVAMSQTVNLIEISLVQLFGFMVFCIKKCWKAQILS